MRVNAQTKHATRQRILDAAKNLFARQGFDSTTTRDIARAAEIAVGTLFNYFPTKESIVHELVRDAFNRASNDFGAEAAHSVPNSESNKQQVDDPLTLEEEYFAHAAAVLRRLKPFRKYLHAALETTLSPLAEHRGDQEPKFRTVHLEVVCRITTRHRLHGQLSAVAIQLYWTLFTGVLTFWSKDRSPRQEDTLALLDQSLAMFVGWLASQPDDSSQELS